MKEENNDIVLPEVMYKYNVLGIMLVKRHVQPHCWVLPCHHSSVSCAPTWDEGILPTVFGLAVVAVDHWSQDMMLELAFVPHPSNSCQSLHLSTREADRMRLGQRTRAPQYSAMVLERADVSCRSLYLNAVCHMPTQVVAGIADPAQCLEYWLKMLALSVARDHI